MFVTTSPSTKARSRLLANRIFSMLYVCIKDNLIKEELALGSINTDARFLSIKVLIIR